MEKITAFLPKGLGSIKENIARCIMDEFACCQLCSQGKESMSDVFREIDNFHLFLSSNSTVYTDACLTTSLFQVRPTVFTLL